MNLIWTSDPPTVPGWYWVRLERTGWIQIVQVNACDIAENSITQCGQFAGPIPEPQEPQKEEK